MEEFLKDIEEKVKQRELEESIDEKDKEEFMIRKTKQEAFEVENTAYKNRLETELTEPVVRSLMRKITPFLKNLWNGEAGHNSSRYSAYKKGGLARRALLYHMITYPFTDDHLKWVLEEIYVSCGRILRRKANSRKRFSFLAVQFRAHCGVATATLRFCVEGNPCGGLHQNLPGTLRHQ